MGRYHIWSIGCQMNTADARNLADQLNVFGYQPTARADEADLVVLYSCMVRQAAEDRVHGQLHLLREIKRRRPRMRIALAGCLGDPEVWRARYPFVDLFVGPMEELTVRDRLIDLLDLDDRYRVAPEDGVPLRGVSESVTVHQGCNRSCTYCIVPKTRGRERSRRPEVIEAEVRGLVARGTREVILLGQIVERYGRDLDPRTSLAELMARLSQIDDLWRIRFLTSYPRDFWDDTIEAVATLPKVCEDINIPVQAGDDEVLRRMRRAYTVEQYLDVIHRIRRRIPDCAIQTDIIVGFPGETEAQFQRTLDLLATVRFDVVHVAMYSPRPGTVAAEQMVDDVPPEEKKRRLHAVEDLQRQIQGEKNAALLGRTLEVLVEGQQKGRWYGRTRTNKLVFFDHEQSLAGQLVPVRITRTTPYSLQGEIAVPAAAVA